MSRKHHARTRTSTHPVVVQPPARDDTLEQQLAGDIAKGAASGTARAIVTWLIEQLTEHLR